jgi:hypothetical protein
MAESGGRNRPEGSNPHHEDDLTRGRGDESVTDRVETADDDELDELEDLEDEDDLEESER